VKNRYFLLFIISGSMIVLDQYTKFMVVLHIPLYASEAVIDGIFNLTHIRNSGVAFGLFSDQQSEYKPLMFITISTIAIIAILVMFHHNPREKKFVQMALILIFSGAIGNLIDRTLHGEVIDFIDFVINGYHFPAFNVADSCITIGVILMGVDLFLVKQEPSSSAKLV